MKSFEIIRLVNNDGIQGVLIYESKIICYTQELEWKKNKRNVSCIPEGQYTCFRQDNTSVSTGSYDYTFEVGNVPNRGSILFHIGNTIDDLKGCIALGLLTGKLKEKNAVLDSRIAFERFIDLVGEDRLFHLIIKGV